MNRDIDQHFVQLLFNARNRIRFAMDDSFRPLGITDATWRALYFLRQGDGVSQKVLAKTMGIEGPSLVRLLDSLESKDFIQRRVDPTDRRSKTIHLTGHAHALLADLDEVSKTVRAEILAGISPAALETCVEVLEKILATDVDQKDEHHD